MFRSLITRFRFIVPMTLMALAVLLASCAPTPTAMQPTVPAQPEPAQPTSVQPTATQVIPSEATVEPGAFSVKLDINGVAQSDQVETIPAVKQSEEHPYWDVLPEHKQITLQGYPVANHLMKPQIFIYPAGELPGWNDGAGKQMADLWTLLSSRKPGEALPQMPLFNAGQVMHARVKFVDFRNGKGVRYVTQYDQAVLPINNHELIYTFQGLTGDGKYYVAAVMPLNFPGLPASELDIKDAPDQFATDFLAYRAGMVKTLDEASPETFTPDLAKLDAMVQSIEIQ